MKFNEFVNRNQNVIESSSRRKITLAIPITEDRQKFYDGTSFKKYDNVTSGGVTYRILEQCSNYYTVVDAAGNTHRKFAKQLTPVLEGIVNPDDSFHGYMIESTRAHELLEENYDAIIDGTIDDVGFLKQLKEADKVDTSYKIRDKLTIAKIIADAIGIPHDAVSSPENLVNQAIRKAAKDPAMLRNKEILQNMLKIASEVGIRFGSSVFDKVEESAELGEGDITRTSSGLIHKGTSGYGNSPVDHEEKTPRAGNKRSFKELMGTHKWKDGREEMPAGTGHTMEPHSAKLPGKRRGLDSDMYESEEQGVTEGSLEELSIDTVKSYSDKAKQSRPDTIKKVGNRFAGQERAQDRIHKDGLKKIGTVKEDDMLTYAALKKKIEGNSGAGGETVPSMDNQDKVEFTPGATLNPTSNTNRKQLINKLKGD